MEFLSERLISLKERIFGAEQTQNIYRYPFRTGTKVQGIIENSPAHKGPYRGAVNFIVDLGTPVLTPFTGKVINVVDSNELYGPSEDYVNDLNYITIFHPNGEYSSTAHLARGSARVKEGDMVLEGQPLAVTGLSGWMTEPHLHLLVFRLSRGKSGFKGLKIRFKQKRYSLTF